MDTRKWFAALGLLTLLGACSGTSGAPVPAATAPGLTSAFDRIPPSAFGAKGDFEFGDTARLKTLAGADKSWNQAALLGAGPLQSLALVAKDTIAVDLQAATAVVTAGRPPAATVTVLGGQDQSAITAAATKAGWSGSAILSRTIDLSSLPDPSMAVLVLAAPKIRPVGVDVVLGGSGSSPALAQQGAGAGTSPDVLAVANCLGDVVAAQGTGLATSATSSVTAVGLRAGSGRVTSVICLGASGGDAAKTRGDRARTALASGTSAATRQPWKELLPGAVVEILDGTPAMVRISSDTTGMPVTRVFQMFLREDLPGLH